MSILLLVCLSPEAHAGKPFIIVQMSDPQFGFKQGKVDPEDVRHELANTIEAIRSINLLRPDIVVITGDIVNHRNNAAQLEAADSMMRSFRKDMEVLMIPGNHDVKTGGGEVDASDFVGHWGYERFSVLRKGCALIGINSTYIKLAPGSDAARENRAWLEAELTKAAESRKTKCTIVFSHYPFFLASPDEGDGYMAISSAERGSYLELFKKSDVNYIFAGHLHNNCEASGDGLQMVVTSSVGWPLGTGVAGIRIITVDGDKVRHRFYETKDIPTDRREVIGSM